MKRKVKALLIRQARRLNNKLPKKYGYLHREGTTTADEKEIKATVVYPGKTHSVSTFPFQMPVDIYAKDTPGKIYELRGGKVWGNTGTVITRENVMMADVSNEFVEQPSRHSLFRQWKWQQPALHKGTVAVIATTGATVYYHWLLQHLPRIHLLQRAGVIEKVDGIVLNYAALPFQTDTLRTMGIPAGKLIKSNTRDFYLESETLLVPSLPFHPFAFDNTASWAFQFLKDTFLEKNESSPGKMWYVSRGSSRGRCIVNEDELLPALQEAGFEKLELDNLPVKEQASLFIQAKMIVAPHGGALANLVFCNPGTRVVEIFNEKWINPCFWDIANKLNIEYHPYVAPFVESDHVKDIKHYDIKLDIADFTTFTKKLISA